MPNHKKTQKRQTRNQDQMNQLPEPPRFVGVYSDPKNIAPEKDKSKKKKKTKSKTKSNSKPVVQTEAVQPVVPKIARPNPLEVKARAAARAAAQAESVPKRNPPLKPRGARVHIVEPPPEPPVTVKRMMPKPKPRTRQTRKAYTYNRPVNMTEFMMAANKPMKKTIPKMSRKSPAFFNIPNGTNELRDAVTEVANSFRVMPSVPSGHIMNPLLRETPNHPLLRGSFMTRKRMSEKAKGRLNVIKE